MSIFYCNRFPPTPATVQQLHILPLATVMTVHLYILQQIIAYRYYYIHTGCNRYKKNTPQSSLLWGFLFWRFCWLVGFLCCCVCVFGVVLALLLKNLGLAGLFTCGLINLLAFIFLGVLGLVLWLVWFGCCVGLVWCKIGNKKNGL